MNQTQNDRVENLKGYLKRLGDGESLETVKVDFVNNFKDVEASEIMKAEQEMIKNGMPITEVKKLCDVHSALFHGSTTEEKIREAEKAVNASLIKEQRMTVTKKLVNTVGHPLYTFTKENEALEKLLLEAKEELRYGNISNELLNQIREVTIHYAKKGDLLYPHLSVKYQITGPSNVMWTVDDEIRDELTDLAKNNIFDNNRKERLDKVLARIEEMIYKEANILFPNCAVNFTEDEWIQIYKDSKDYSNCLGIEQEIWNLAEETNISDLETLSNDQEIIMGGGHMTVHQLAAMLNTMPFEITFVDDKNINRFFNEGHKDFKRTKMALDREVFYCHPPKIEAQVRRILDEFRAGTLDKVPVWMDKNGRPMLVTYFAVRDKSNHYLGTLEVVQDMSFAKEHFAKVSNISVED